MEGRLDSVLELYEKLVACVESLESIAPVIDAQESLFVRVKL